ncbi:MAG TPA: hypothetical protein VGB30_09580 [bacterium]|jgi:hypothetical protein
MKSPVCPYCGGSSKKITGRVVRQSTHHAFGYGERIYRCDKCSEEFRYCFPVPPKAPRKDYEVPNPDTLKLSFREGIGGTANPVVVSAKGVAYFSPEEEIIAPAEQTENVDTPVPITEVPEE